MGQRATASPNKEGCHSGVHGDCIGAEVCTGGALSTTPWATLGVIATLPTVSIVGHHTDSGAAGRGEDAQVGVFATTCGTAVLDQALYLPRAWISNRRRAAPGVSAVVGFTTKVTLAKRLLARAVVAGGRWMRTAGCSISSSRSDASRRRTPSRFGWLKDSRLSHE